MGIFRSDGKGIKMSNEELREMIAAIAVVIAEETGEEISSLRIVSVVQIS